LLDRSLFTLDAWIRKGMPFTKKGNQTTEWEFDVSAVCKWREEHAIASVVGDVEDIGLEELKKRKLAAETALLEIELQQRKREVILLSEVE
jgi:terminase small subunit / prophage DNA-packing protein